MNKPKSIFFKIVIVIGFIIISCIISIKPWESDLSLISDNWPVNIIKPDKEVYKIDNKSLFRDGMQYMIIEYSDNNKVRFYNKNDIWQEKEEDVINKVNRILGELNVSKKNYPDLTDYSYGYITKNGSTDTGSELIIIYPKEGNRVYIIESIYK